MPIIKQSFVHFIQITVSTTQSQITLSYMDSIYIIVKQGGFPGCTYTVLSDFCFKNDIEFSLGVNQVTTLPCHDWGKCYLTC